MLSSLIKADSKNKEQVEICINLEKSLLYQIRLTVFARLEERWKRDTVIFKLPDQQTDEKIQSMLLQYKDAINSADYNQLMTILKLSKEKSINPLFDFLDELK